MRKHLVCHIYPRACHGTWRRTARALRQRWGLFDGRRIIAIAMDETTDTAEEVIESFAGDAEFLVGPNVPGLQETASFVQSLERVIDEPGITFRCHAKGATHCPHAASAVWGDVMFATCLDFPELIDHALAELAIAGAFRAHGIWAHEGYPNVPPWHFAGSFYWFRNDAARERHWRNLPQTYFGIEAWPGLFPLSESACLFFDHAQTGHLYDLAFWGAQVAPALALFERRLSGCSAGRAWLPSDSPLRYLARNPFRFRRSG